MPVNQNDIEAGISAGITRIYEAFGEQLDYETLSRNPGISQLRDSLIAIFNNHEDVHPRFVILFCDLAVTGLLARQITGDEQPPLNDELLNKALLQLESILNSFVRK